jgi:hypothetical protein
MPVSESDRSGEIGAIVNTRSDPQGPGVAVAVVRGGQVIHCKGYGVAQMEWGQPITPDTVFGIGSVTKSFTATAILERCRSTGSLRGRGARRLRARHCRRAVLLVRGETQTRRLSRWT